MDINSIKTDSMTSVLESVKKMSTFQKVCLGMQIFDRHEGDICAEHDEIFVQTKENVTQEENGLLVLLDWRRDTDNGEFAWRKFV